MDAETATLSDQSGPDQHLNFRPMLVASRLHFRIDKDTGGIVISVLNSTSGEIIREIYMKETNAFTRKLSVIQRGLFLNFTA